MINIPSFQGQDFNKLSYEDLLSELKSVKGFDNHKLRNSSGGYPIYGFSIGGINNKPMMLIDGCIHKDHEWRSSYWIMQFMKMLSDPLGYSSAHIRFINYLKSKYSFYFIPVISPDAYTDYNGNGAGANANNVNISENFDYRWEETPYEYDIRNKGPAPFSEPETKNVRDVVLEYKPVGYVNCHTWGSERSGYMIRHPMNKSYDAMTVDLFNSIRLSTKLHVEDSTIGPAINISTAYNWVGAQNSRQGRKIVSNVLESGGGQKTIDQSILGVTGLLMNCIYIDNYITKNTLTMNWYEP